MNELHLFRIRTAQKQRTLGVHSNPNAAPDLVPIGEQHVINRATGLSQNNEPQLIDVVNDFEWTHTPPAGRHEIPHIRMSEYHINFNALVAQLRYFLTLATEGIGQIGKDASINKKLQDIIEKGEGTPGIGYILSVLKKIVQKIKDTSTLDTVALDEVEYWLKPYYGIYSVIPTGFEYSFPYFTEPWKSVNNSYGEIRGGTPLENLAKTSPQALIGQIAETLSTVTRGAFVDRPKMYVYDGEGNELTFNFHLFNTNKWEDVYKNWQLVYMLVYQNLANKLNRVLYDPPVIYEVEVPGVYYSPFAYIQSLNIIQHGTTREMVVPIVVDDEHGEKFIQAPPENAVYSTESERIKRGNFRGRYIGSIGSVRDDGRFVGPEHIQGVQTVIPEVWEVSITIRSLLPESKNFLFHTITKSNNDLYDVIIKHPEQNYTQKFDPSVNTRNNVQGAEDVQAIAGDFERPGLAS